MATTFLPAAPPGTTSIWNLGDSPSQGFLPPAAIRGFHELDYATANQVDVEVGCYVNFYMTLTQDTLLNNPTGAYSSGDIINIVLLQDSVGSQSVTFGSKYRFHGGFAPQFDDTAGAVNFLCAIYFDPLDIWLCSWLAGMTVPA